MRFRLSIQERKVVIIGLLALLVAVVTYGGLSSTGAFQNKVWNLGGAIVGFLAVVVVLNRVYGRGFQALQGYEESSSGAAPHHRCSPTELIEGSDEITVSMIAEVHRAQTYIFTIGGRSRNEAYLEAVKKRVLRGDIRYVRVITGDHIRHLLCKHLHALENHVELGHLLEEKYGAVMVTHDTTFIALPSPNVSILDRALKIKSEAVAADYRSYVAELLGSSKKEIDSDFIRKLCIRCREDGAQQDIRGDK